MKKKGVAILIIGGVTLITLIVTVTGYLVSQRLAVDRYVFSDKLNLKICHISDLHIPNLGVSDEKILTEVKNADVDLIVLTGDIIDGRANSDDLKTLDSFLLRLRAVAPVYGVIGNHEIGSELYDDYLSVCADNGVEILLNESALVKINSAKLFVTGLTDGNLFSEKNLPSFERERLAAKADVSVLLAHRPELVESYLDGDFDVIFAGHAHGGQARIFNRGMYAPNQGLFPRYTSGEYSFGDTKMYVSRGLGDGNNKFRYLNPYNIIIVDL